MRMTTIAMITVGNGNSLRSQNHCLRIMVLQLLTKIILNGQLVRIVALLVGGPRRRIRRLAISVQGQVSVDG